MNSLINRVLSEANHMLNTKETIRQIANKFNVSKSTVHKDLSERLKTINPSIYNEINIILQNHLAERHIRGGEATQQKYQKRSK